MGRRRVNKVWYSGKPYWVMFDDMAFKYGLFAIGSRVPYRIAFTNPTIWRRQRAEIFGFSSKKPLHRRK